MRCPGHNVLGPARLDGFALCFPRHSPARGCGVAGIEERPAGVVWGALFRLAETDIAALDRSEGYRPHDADWEHRYRPHAVRARGPHGAPVPAWTYMAMPDASGALPSAAYLAHLVAGARHFALPRDYVAMLEALPVAPS